MIDKNNLTEKDLTPEEFAELKKDPRQQPQWPNYDDELKQMLISQYEEYNNIKPTKPPKLEATTDPEQVLLLDRRKIVSQLCDARFKSGLTQAQMAAKMGISQPTLARLESDKSNPSLQTLVKMARVLGVSVKIG